MTARNPSDADPRAPLGAHGVLLASDKDSLVAGLERAYGVRKVDFAGGDAPFYAAANRVELRSVTLHYCRYDTPTRIDFGAIEGFRQLFPLTGAGQIRAGGRQAQIVADAAGVIAPGTRFDASYGAHYSHLVVQVAEDEVRRKAELLFGASLKSEIQGAPLSPAPGNNAARLRAIAMALAAQFSYESGGGGIVSSELEQALVSAFLLENRAAFAELSAQRSRLAGRADVSRLEDYIQANWDRPLQIEDVAEACGVSVRSVFERFKQSRSVSPHTYLRNVRLDHARRLLLEGDSRLSVTDIALRCGFSSFGHFARRYRERFAELPSATLSRRA